MVVFQDIWWNKRHKWFLLVIFFRLGHITSVVICFKHDIHTYLTFISLRCWPGIECDWPAGACWCRPREALTPRSQAVLEACLRGDLAPAPTLPPAPAPRLYRYSDHVHRDRHIFLKVKLFLFTPYLYIQRYNLQLQQKEVSWRPMYTHIISIASRR